MSNGIDPELATFLERRHPGNAAVVRLARDRPEYRALFERQMAEAQDAPDPPLPPLATMAANYARSTARHLMAGCPTADAATVAARLAACRGCDRFRPADERCSACGCPTAVKSVRLLETCPLARWPA